MASIVIAIADFMRIYLHSAVISIDHQYQVDFVVASVDSLGFNSMKTPAIFRQKSQSCSLIVSSWDFTLGKIEYLLGFCAFIKKQQTGYR